MKDLITMFIFFIPLLLGGWFVLGHDKEAAETIGMAILITLFIIGWLFIAMCIRDKFL